jgi:N-dimethylarginine dimethylaminohydrolase
LTITSCSAAASLTGNDRSIFSFLMCPPTYFDVTYSINPWMRPADGADPRLAMAQWTALRDQLQALGHTIELMPADPLLPDLVFAANGGIVVGERALVPRFRFPQRVPEVARFEQALSSLGLQTKRSVALNEGEGDFRMAGSVMLAGWGLRSEESAAAEVAEYFGVPVLPLRLVDPRFYHLDTALAVLDSNTVAYLPQAFDAHSRRELRRRFPAAIEAEPEDAEQLGLNLISDGHNVVMGADSPTLAQRLRAAGYEVHPVELGELRKAGGGPKCCVLTVCTS